MVPENAMAGKLVADFASMANGLVPNLALKSLTAVRDNAHRVIEKFHSRLDPAYLTHVACLGSPEEAQQHMVAQIASELQAIMNDATADDEPLGFRAIKEWLDAELGADAGLECGNEKRCSRKEVEALLNGGWEEGKPDALRKRDGFRHLTAGFSKGRDTTHEMDRELAWMICFRTVVNAPVPILQMGSVVYAGNCEQKEEYFLCMTPKCDSVRLVQRTVFLLLPLKEPKMNTAQLVLRTCNGEYRRVSVVTKIGEWTLRGFDPVAEKGMVVGTRDRDGGLYFVDAEGVRFNWVGELRDEFAQQLAQRLGSELERIPVSNSEWLRREERLDGE